LTYVAEKIKIKNENRSNLEKKENGRKRKLKMTIL